ncbi:ICMT-domain-containing protein [Trametes cingulata]|nr:ICMT-domain-containing protein [Trametes cingulata]
MLSPLVKVPLLPSNAGFLSSAFKLKPPRPPPPPTELKRFDQPDLMSATASTQMTLAAIVRTALCGVALAEAAVIVAQQYPSELSRTVFSILPGAYRVRTALHITPVFLVGSALTAAGSIIRIFCYHALGKFFTWQVSVQDDHKLITAGPYAVVRHPSYTGWTLLAVGKAMAVLSRGSYFVESGMWATWQGKAAAGTVVGYLAFVTYALLSRVEKEDAVLSRQFGEEWGAWAQRTPYRLIPFVY